eukprot:CAMPEP_0206002490 /NCGR_PEP_ID=MMETSP1464-20131121/2781_1 /ASSEMBLY_ACC=CAM_ASM_001124 /TAXON_ID=119497 /ORGANISM="Exanthemachrysis gayraliae, Strain RCC1523" /LENGTH=121 /DNA_ID=CAMNT_0053375835 /DNA_START=62 /DNA_END=424 /DNA_ORIENTATION=+
MSSFVNVTGTGYRGPIQRPAPARSAVRPRLALQSGRGTHAIASMPPPETDSESCPAVSNCEVDLLWSSPGRHQQAVVTLLRGASRPSVGRPGSPEGLACVHGVAPELVLDAQELVVLGEAL